jgi:hypothetical protein
MGTLILSELQDEVRAGLGGRTDLDTRLTRFLNLSQQRLARLHDFDEMETSSVVSLTYTGADTDGDISLPTLREVYSVRVIDDSRSRKLVQKSPRWWDKMIPMPNYPSRDIPQLYMIWSSTVYVFPLPEKDYATVKLRWTKWPTALSAAGTASEFLQKDELLIELAISYAYRSLGNPEEAAKHEAVAKRLFLESDTIDRERPDLEQVGDAREGSAQGVQDYWRDPFVRSIDS